MQNILVIQLRQLGDILLTTPCIHYLKALFPNANIDFLCHPMGKLVLENNPYLNECIYYSEKDSGFLGSLEVFKRIRAKQYDVTFDFMNNPRSGLFTLLSRTQNRVSFKSKRFYFYNLLVAKPSDSEYIVHTKLRLVKKYLETLDGSLASKSSDNRICIDLPFLPTDTLATEKFFENSQIKKDKVLVVLSPTHRRDNRKWPVERYVQLASWLLKERDAEIIWCWGPGEKDFVDSLAIQVPGSYLVPKTTFAELAAFFTNCDYFIGNSNGPSHVAVSAGTPSLQLHGHTDAVSWCPSNKKHQFIQSEEFGQPKPTLNSISLDMVKNKVETQWEFVLEEKTKKFGPERKIITDWKPNEIS